jgi:hypothetical protein
MGWQEGIRSAHRFPAFPAESIDYSVFDSALNRMCDAKWLFPIRDPRRQVFVCGVEVKATSRDVGDVEK